MHPRYAVQRRPVQHVAALFFTSGIVLDSLLVHHVTNLLLENPKIVKVALAHHRHITCQECVRIQVPRTSVLMSFECVQIRQLPHCMVSPRPSHYDAESDAPSPGN